MMDIHPEQWRRLTPSLGLPCLQLVEGLVQLAVQMRFESDYLVEIQGMRQQTSTRHRKALPLREYGVLIRGHAPLAPDG